MIYVPCRNQHPRIAVRKVTTARPSTNLGPPDPPMGWQTDGLGTASRRRPSRRPGGFCSPTPSPTVWTWSKATAAGAAPGGSRSAGARSGSMVASARPVAVGSPVAVLGRHQPLDDACPRPLLAVDDEAGRPQQRQRLAGLVAAGDRQHHRSITRWMARTGR